MRIALVYPPGDEFAGSFRFPPLGIAYLAAFLRRAGIHPTILDLRFLSDTNLSDEKLLQEAVDAVSKVQPDLLGLYCNSAVFPFVNELATAIKKVIPQVHLTLGGPHATFLANEILGFNSSVDSIVRGEAEITMMELIRSLQSHESELSSIPGLSYRFGDRILHNQSRAPLRNIDTLPIPDFDVFAPLESYQSQRRRIFVPILASRGCPFNCSFCAAKAMWGHQRRRDPSEVLTEMKLRMDRYGEELMFGFLDDEFVCNREWVTAICERIREARLETQWTAFSRIDTVTHELLRKLRESGCRNLYYGIESGSQRILDRMNKGYRAVTAMQIVKDTLAAGIDVTASFILGFPGESLEDMTRTIDLAVEMTEISATVHLFPFCVLPGTALWNSRVQVIRLHSLKHLTLGPKRPFIRKYSHLQWCVPDAWICKLDGVAPESFRKIFEFALETIVRTHTGRMRPAYQQGTMMTKSLLE